MALKCNTFSKFVFKRYNGNKQVDQIIGGLTSNRGPDLRPLVGRHVLARLSVPHHLSTDDHLMSLRVHEVENTLVSVVCGAPPCFDVFCQISFVIFSHKRQVSGGQDFPQESGFVIPFEHFLRPGQGVLGVHPAPTVAIGLSLSQLPPCHHPESVIDLTTCVTLKHVFHRSTHVCQNLFTFHTITKYPRSAR